MKIPKMRKVEMKIKKIKTITGVILRLPSVWIAYVTMDNLEIM